MDRRTFSTTMVLLMLATVCGATCFSALRKASKGIEWHRDLREAHEIAVKTNKPMLIVFSAEWCSYCKKLEATTLAHPQMVAYVNAAFVPVHLDLNEDKRIAEILEVTSIPCTIVLSPDADLLGRLVGYAKPQQYYESLAEARRLHAQIEQTLYLQKR